MMRKENHDMARQKKTKSAPTRIDDIDWNGVAKALTNERLNASEVRGRFCPQISPPTFKTWAESPSGLGAKYRIDWGRTGRNNYIRITERTEVESELMSSMADLVFRHGMLSCVRALAEVSSGTRR
jgi:hypothetical protein